MKEIVCQECGFVGSYAIPPQCKYEKCPQKLDSTPVKHKEEKIVTIYKPIEDGVGMNVVRKEESKLSAEEIDHMVTSAFNNIIDLPKEVRIKLVTLLAGSKWGKPSKEEKKEKKEKEDSPQAKQEFDSLPNGTLKDVLKANKNLSYEGKLAKYKEARAKHEKILDALYGTERLAVKSLELLYKEEALFDPKSTKVLSARRDVVIARENYAHYKEYAYHILGEWYTDPKSSSDKKAKDNGSK